MYGQTIMRTAAGIALVCAVTFLGGCSPSDGRVAVSGTVTLDGRPLEVAAINFRPAPGNEANSAGGGVKDGKFSLPTKSGLKPGEYLVNVMARKETGRMIFDPQRGKKIPETVPVNVNENGTFKVTVKPGGEPLEIVLTSAGAASTR